MENDMKMENENIAAGDVRCPFFFSKALSQQSLTVRGFSQFST